MSTGEKTESPSQKRLEKARKSGRVARSELLSVGIVLLTGCALFYVLQGIVSSFVFSQLQSVFSGALGQVSSLNESSEALIAALVTAVSLSLPVLIIIWVVTLLVKYLQVAPNFAISPIRFKRSSENFRFSIAALLESARTVSVLLTLTILVEAIAALVSVYFFEDLGNLIFLDFEVAQMTAIALFVRFCLLLGGCFLVVGAADMFVSRFLLLRELKMTRDDASAEAREHELSPAIRAKLAESRRKMRTENLATVIPNTSFVISGTEQSSYAFSFDEESGAAPVLVSSGEGLLGIRIKSLAEKHQIPIVESKVISESLVDVDVGSPIPKELYKDFIELMRNLG